NIRTKARSDAKPGKMRLRTTGFSKPSAPIWRARKISAIPPSAIFLSTRYRMPTDTARRIHGGTGEAAPTTPAEAQPKTREPSWARASSVNATRERLSKAEARTDQAESMGAFSHPPARSMEAAAHRDNGSGRNAYAGRCGCAACVLLGDPPIPDERARG